MVDGKLCSIIYDADYKFAIVNKQNYNGWKRKKGSLTLLISKEIQKGENNILIWIILSQLHYDDEKIQTPKVELCLIVY